MPGLLSDRTFHHVRYAGLGRLAAMKKERELRISVCIPTLNEAHTIGGIVGILRAGLMKEVPLVDEIAVVDSGSTDGTREIAREAGARVFSASEILPEVPAMTGKGENLWRALYALEGDIICCVDGDIRNMHPRFVYGLVGPLIEDERLGFVKAFYDRPQEREGAGRPAGGGRVTEILVRPMFSLFFPELCQVVQPLSGEYAARREVFERLSFPVGYGVETAHLIDIARIFGMEIMAQVDLDERIHRHQDVHRLGRMSHGILQTLLKRIPRAAELVEGDEYRHILREGGMCHLVAEEVDATERPPICQIAAYREKFPELSGNLQLLKEPLSR